MLTEAVILVKLVKVILVTVNRLLAGLQLFWCCAMLTESVILVKLVKVVLVSNVICLAARRHPPQRASPFWWGEDGGHVQVLDR